MRQAVWRALEAAMPAGGRLLDLGCGPGHDAVHLARRGHRVVAVDLSPAMVAAARARAAAAGVADRVSVEAIGIHEVAALPAGPFDGIYSDFGALNCVPDLPAVARACAQRLRPGGKLVVCVMGRHVPWERVHDRLRGDGRRTAARRAPGMTAVSMSGHRVWTAYYTPGEFFSAFAPHFHHDGHRGLGLLLPPPSLAARSAAWPRLGALLGLLEDRLAGLPLLREAGDHFLMTMTRRATGEEARR
jgi:SAM-dependent methyltransferase